MKELQLFKDYIIAVRAAMEIIIREMKLCSKKCNDIFKKIK